MALKTTENRMKYHLLEHISFTQVDDEAVLLDLNTGGYFGLNHIGTHFLKIVQNQNAENHIELASKEISELYQIDQNRVRSDLGELVQELLQSSLLAEST